MFIVVVFVDSGGNEKEEEEGEEDVVVVVVDYEAKCSSVQKYNMFGLPLLEPRASNKISFDARHIMRIAEESKAVSC